MFAAILLANIAVASAFVAPVTRVSSRSIVMNDMIGPSIEIDGGKVHDPLNFLKLHSVNSEVFPHPKWLRESELKHCRMAMLASIGAFSAQYGLVIPGYSAVPDPVENLNQFVVNYPLAFAQIILAIGIIEGHFFPGDFWFGKGDREAGNLGYDPLGFSRGKPQAVQDKYKLNELKNGRLAMMAMAAYTSEHWIPGSVPFIPGHF